MSDRHSSSDWKRVKQLQLTKVLTTQQSFDVKTFHLVNKFSELAGAKPLSRYSARNILADDSAIALFREPDARTNYSLVLRDLVRSQRGESLRCAYSSLADIARPERNHWNCSRNRHKIIKP